MMCALGLVGHLVELLDLMGLESGLGHLVELLALMGPEFGRLRLVVLPPRLRLSPCCLKVLSMLRIGGLRSHPCGGLKVVLLISGVFLSTSHLVEGRSSHRSHSVFGPLITDYHFRTVHSSSPSCWFKI